MRATVRFLDGVRPHGWKYAGTTVPTPGHPSGQWSLLIDLKTAVDERGVATADVYFMSPRAPAHMLQAGVSLRLFEGSRCIALVTPEEP